MTRRAILLAALALATQTCIAQQAATRVDDTGTVVSASSVRMNWRTSGPGRANAREVGGKLDVLLHLNLAPWLRRNVRLYLVLDPPATPGVVAAVSWQTNGHLLPGSLLPGGRAVIFEGPVSQSTLDEKLSFNFTADGTLLSAPQALQFHIEAETR